MAKKVFFSGIQSSNSSLHIGNYLGAIENFKRLQKQNPDATFLFMVADLHSLTTKKINDNVKNNIENLVATYIASKLLDHKNSYIFVQSDIPQHCEMTWIFSTMT